jgi:hypothetical protein
MHAKHMFSHRAPHQLFFFFEGVLFPIIRVYLNLVQLRFAFHNTVLIFCLLDGFEMC